MKTVNLTFVTRVKVADILGLVNGPLVRTRPLEPVYDAVVFSEAEQARMTVEDIGEGRRVFKAARPEEFDKEITLENAQAAALRRELDEFQHYRMGDSAWVEELKAQLEAPPEMPKHEFKQRRKG